MSDPPAGGWEPGDRPSLLTLAVFLVVAETSIQLLAIAWRDEFRLPLRLALMASVALKYLFGWLVLRRSAGAVLGLMLFEATAVVVALSATAWPSAARILLATTALAIIALLAASAHAFPSPPSPTLPRT